MAKIKRALISVSDKTGIVEFARELSKMGVEIISSGGTAKALEKEGIKTIEVGKITGFPPILDGRVKTLHFPFYAGILADRSKKDHMETLKKYKVDPIDMVVVNLYPFEQVISRPDAPFEEAIENIDIGGPCMIRAAAKNFEHVAVIVNPLWYKDILVEMERENGELSRETKARLAREVFAMTSKYDTTILKYLSKNIGGNE